MSNLDTRQRTGLRISEIELCAWLSQAAPQDALESHRGFLVLDVDAKINRIADRERLELVRVARRAWWASEKKLVHLVQRRRGANQFSYLAIARPRPDTAPSSLSPLLLKEAA
jgi:hypothetical protein